MNRRVLLLGLTSFAMGTEAFVYVGHLSAMAQDLNVSVAAAGLLAAGFALTNAAAAPFIAGWTARFDRKSLLVSGLLAIAACNIAAAIAPTFETILWLRIAAGVAAAAAGPAASAAAAALAAPHERGRALGVVLAGMTLAFVVGVPLGSVAGGFAGWRATFAFAALILLAAAAAVSVGLPRVGGGGFGGLGALRVALRPDIAHSLGLTVVGFAATFTAIAYIGPLALHIAGIEGAGVGALQALIGLGGVAGVIAGARAADGPGAQRLLLSSFVVSALALSLYSVLALHPLGPFATLAALACAMMMGAAALFARTPEIQARLVRQAPDSAGVVLALNGSMVFVGQGLGAAAGALTLMAADLTALGFAGAGIALFGLWLASRSTPALAARAAST